MVITEYNIIFTVETEVYGDQKPSEPRGGGERKQNIITRKFSNY